MGATSYGNPGSKFSSYQTNDPLFNEAILPSLSPSDITTLLAPLNGTHSRDTADTMKTMYGDIAVQITSDSARMRQVATTIESRRKASQNNNEDPNMGTTNVAFTRRKEMYLVTHWAEKYRQVINPGSAQIENWPSPQELHGRNLVVTYPEFPLPNESQTNTQLLCSGKQYRVQDQSQDIFGDPITLATVLTNANQGPVAVLNPANARVPGGGSRQGIRTLEESYGQRLYGFLSGLEAHSELYGNRRFLDHEGVTVTHAIPVVSYAGDTGDLLVPMTPQLVDHPIRVISAAAPNFKANQHNPADALDAADYDRINGQGSYAVRIKREYKQVLIAAAESGCRSVILCGLGTGSFGNDPAVVGRLLGEVLRENWETLRSFFDRIIIHDFGYEGGRDYTAFQSAVSIYHNKMV